MQEKSLIGCQVYSKRSYQILRKKYGFAIFKPLLEDKVGIGGQIKD